MHFAITQPILKRIIYSIGVIIAWLIILFVSFYPDESGLGKTFVVVIFLIFTLFFSVAIGLIVMILRLLHYIKESSFVFVFTGVLNMCFGISGILLLFFHSITETNYIMLFLGSFLIGLVMIGEIILVKDA